MGRVPKWPEHPGTRSPILKDLAGFFSWAVGIQVKSVGGLLISANGRWSKRKGMPRGDDLKVSFLGEGISIPLLDQT